MSKKIHCKALCLAVIIYLMENTVFKIPRRHPGLLRTTIFKRITSNQYLETSMPVQTRRADTASIISFSGKQHPISSPMPKAHVIKPIYRYLNITNLPSVHYTQKIYKCFFRSYFLSHSLKSFTSRYMEV